MVKGITVIQGGSRLGRLLFAGLLIAALTLYLDSQTPLGVAAGLPHVVLVLLGLSVGRRRIVAGLAVTATLLVAVGYILSEPGSAHWIVLTNRSLSVLLIWAVAGLIVLGQRARREMNRFFELSRAMLCVMSGTAAINRVNPAFHRVLGPLPQRPLGVSLLEFVCPEDRERVESAIRTMDGSAEFEARFRALDGSPRWLSWMVMKDPESDNLYAAGRDLTERRRAEEAVQSSEARYRALIQAMPDLLFIQTAEGVYVDWHGSSPKLLMVPPEKFLGRDMRDVLPPELSGMFAQRLEKVLQSGEAQVFEYPTVLSGNRLHFEARMVPCGGEKVLTIIRDITERKNMEASLEVSEGQLHKLAADLILVQEKERKWMSRELHDDFNQQLAVLGLELAKLERIVGRVSNAVLPQIRVLKERVGTLSEGIRNMAHRLHPAVLDHLGLAPALESECLSFSARRDIPVEFTARDLPGFIPEEHALCVYRIARECLRNVGQHARASQVSVTLEGVRDGIRLQIQDNGVGFRMEAPGAQKGLGLVSMRERVRLVDGSLALQSSPGKGTLVEVVIPIPEERASEKIHGVAG